jgi:uncharacterized membrane protein YtjA (UPF0391 family)
MLYYAIIFSYVAVVAGQFSFKGEESDTTNIAKLFFITQAVLLVLATVWVSY